MKKILISLLLATQVLSCCDVLERCAFVDFNESLRSDVMDIVLTDPTLFCENRFSLSSGEPTHVMYQREAKQKVESMLLDSHVIKQVLTMRDSVVGFVILSKQKETSIESLRTRFGSLFDDENFRDYVLKSVDELKQTDAECEEFVKIDYLIVSRTFRGKGCGRMLLRDAISHMRQVFPTITQVRLDVNVDNSFARALYESEGFKPFGFGLKMKYRKDLL